MLFPWPRFSQTQTQNHRRLLRFQIPRAKCGRRPGGGKELHNMRWLTTNSAIMITITGIHALFLTSKWLQTQLPIHKGVAFSARNNREPLGSVVELVQTDSLRWCYLPLHTVRLIELTTRWRFLKPLLNTYLGFAAIWLSCARLNFLPIPSAKIRTPVFRRARDDPTTESWEIPSVMTSSTWGKWGQN